MPKMSDYPDRGTLLDDDIFTVAADDTYKITYGDMKAQIIEGVDAGEGGGSTLPEGEAGQFPVNVGGNDVEFRFITGSDLTDALDELGISSTTVPADIVNSVNGETGAVFVTTDSINALSNSDPDAVTTLLQTLDDVDKTAHSAAMLPILGDDQMLIKVAGVLEGLDYTTVAASENTITVFVDGGVPQTMSRTEFMGFLRNGFEVSEQDANGDFVLTYAPNVSVYNVTLTANSTLTALEGFPATGFSAQLNIIQDATGSRTFAVDEAEITRFNDVTLAPASAAGAVTKYVIQEEQVGLLPHIYRIGVMG